MCFSNTIIAESFDNVNWYVKILKARSRKEIIIKLFAALLILAPLREILFLLLRLPNCH